MYRGRNLSTFQTNWLPLIIIIISSSSSSSSSISLSITISISIAIKFSLGGSSPYASTDKKNKNK